MTPPPSPGVREHPHAPSRPSPPADKAAARLSVLSRIRFRRALTLVLMTLVLPGSAQLVVGNKRVGRIAIRTWLCFLLGIGLVALLGLVSRTLLIQLFSSTAVLALVRLG